MEKLKLAFSLLEFLSKKNGNCCHNLHSYFLENLRKNRTTDRFLFLLKNEEELLWHDFKNFNKYSLQIKEFLKLILKFVKKDFVNKKNDIVIESIIIILNNLIKL